MSLSIISQYDQRQEPSRQERSNSETFSLKVLNNLMKRVLIAEAVARFPENQTLVVVDLCGGKAGDLKKWIHTKRKLQYYLIDASPVEVERAERRFKELNAEEQACFEIAKFICVDAFSNDLLKVKELEGKAHIISCQFAVHYAYETEAKADQFWSIIGWLSQQNTVLAMSHPIRQRIIEWCRAFSKKRKTIDGENQLCSISFADPQMEQLIASSESSEAAMKFVPQYGACYRFTLADALYQVPEFLLSSTLDLHQKASKLAGMHCDFNTTVDFRALVKSKEAEDALKEVKNVQISGQEYQVACLYQYSLYTCAKPETKVQEEVQEALEWTCNTNAEEYFHSRIHPGEAVGPVAAQSLGEPSTQMTLDSFHETVQLPLEEVQKEQVPLEEPLEKKKKPKSQKVTVEPRRSGRTVKK